MLGLAFGPLNLKPAEFWAMTWYEFWCAEMAFWDWEHEKERRLWQRHAEVVCAVYNTIPRTKGSHPLQPSKFIPAEFKRVVEVKGPDEKLRKRRIRQSAVIPADLRDKILKKDGSK